MPHFLARANLISEWNYSNRICVAQNGFKTPLAYPDTQSVLNQFVKPILAINLEWF